MTIKVRIVSLSGSADEILRSQAVAENQDPDVFASLVLEMAIRERHALELQFAEAAAKVRDAG
jgi:hypothetical protein